MLTAETGRCRTLVQELEEASYRTGVLLPPWESRFITALQVT